MSRLADSTRFGEAGVGGTWYANPPYPESQGEVDDRWPQFRANAELVHALAPTGNKVKVGIAGCGYGWSMAYLNDLYSRDVWGIEGTWATLKGRSLLVQIRDRIIEGDVTVGADVANWRAQAGIGAKQRFDLVLTEDLLTCAVDDAEVGVMLTNLRAVAASLVHLVTPGPPALGAAGDVLWHTPAQWQTLVGSDPLYLVGTPPILVP